MGPLHPTETHQPAAPWGHWGGEGLTQEQTSELAGEDSGELTWEQTSCRLVAMFLAGLSQRKTWHLSICVSWSRAT